MSRRPSILNLVKHVQYRAYVQLEAVLQPLGITAVQFRILATLAARPGVTSADLARIYEVRPQTMIKQIAMLENKGLIDRRESDANRRLLELTLSEAGRKTLAVVEQDARALESRLLESLAPSEQAQLAELLGRLASAWGSPAPSDSEEFSGDFGRPGLQRS